MDHAAASENLFSYGTLQLEKVQVETFGRKLQGQPAVLTGYSLSMIKIEDEAVVATSGQAYHPMLTYTGNVNDAVKGMVLQITPEELKQADAYEVDDYKRISVSLKSGENDWVYVSAK